jgi:hypothetical protein
MSAAWSWVIQHWKAFGITVPATLGGLVWFYTKCRAQHDKRLDARVLEVLGNHGWSRNRPFTGGGENCVRAAEIGDLLHLNLDVVADSLERMESKGRVLRTDDVPPYWFVVRR